MDERKQKKPSSAMETTTLTRVPESERRPWWSLAFIWAGSVICIPALMVDSMVMAGMDFKQSCLCMVIGYVIVVFYMCLMGIQSSDLGLPCTVAISRAYGVRGSSFLVSLVIAISNIGWFGSQTALCATSFCNIMSGYLHIDFPLWLSCIIWGSLMFITSVYGVKLIDFLNRVSVPALFIMLIWGVIAALMRGAAAAVTVYQPPMVLGWTYGITLAVAGFASGAVTCGDYTRYGRNRRDTILSCIVGVLPAGIGALVIGGFLAVAMGNFDLSVVFSSFGFPIIGMLVLILATWTTNTGNAYISGIAICNMFKLKDGRRPVVTLIAGAAGTALALLGIADVFAGFLNIIAALVPAVAGVAIADYWIMGRGRADLWEPFEGVNWIGVVSKGQKIEDKVSVPDVRSKTKSGAQSELKAAGLKVSIKEAYSDDVAKGEVISQTPSHGSKVSKNTTVVITVSKGKKEDQTVSVPNLRYYTESEASQELQRFGLSLGSVLTEYSDSVEKGLVIRQRISSGSKVKKGTAVGIYVSLGPRQTATTADEESTTTDEE